MSDGCSALCEQAFYAGAAGNCTYMNATEAYECVCPEGYSGTDDFFFFDDCRVNEQVQFVNHVLVAISGIIASLFSLGGLVYLMLYWDYVDPEAVLRRGSGYSGFMAPQSRTGSASSGARGESNSCHKDDAQIQVRFPQCEKEEEEDGESRQENTESSSKLSGDGDSFFSMPEQPNKRPPLESAGSDYSLGSRIGVGLAPAQARQARKQAKKKRHREYFSFLSLIMCTMYAAASLAYVVPFFLGQFRWEVNWVQDLSLAWMASSLLLGAWFWFYIWYENLPSLKLYGKLFNVQNLLIRRPKIVQIVTIVRCIAIVLVNGVLLFLLPMLYLSENPQGDEEQALALKYNLILNWTLCVWAIDFTIFSSGVLHMLRSLFAQLRSLSSQAKEKGISTGTEHETFDKALRVIMDAQIAVIILGSACVVLFLLNAVVPAVGENSYVSANLAVFVGNLIVVTLAYFTVFKLRGQKTVKRRARSVSNADSASTDHA